MKQRWPSWGGIWKKLHGLTIVVRSHNSMTRAQSDDDGTRYTWQFLSTAMSGELQLGGYDRGSTNADMVYVPTTSTTEYSVNVQSLTVSQTHKYFEEMNLCSELLPQASFYTHTRCRIVLAYICFYLIFSWHALHNVLMSLWCGVSVCVTCAS